MNKGFTKEHYVSVTDEQHKMYINDIEQSTLDHLLYYVHHTTRPLTVSYHLINKINHGEISIDRRVIEKVLKEDIDFTIVEVNKTKNDLRILIRGRNTVLVNLDGYDNVKANLCVSYSVSKNRIVTAYYNRVNDHHKHIDMNRYTYVDIDRMLAELERKDRNYAKRNHRTTTY